MGYNKIINNSYLKEGYMQMRVEQLKTLLENAPNDAIVVVPGSDHSYKAAEASVEVAEFNPKSNQMWEHYGVENFGAKSNKTIKVLVIK